MSLLPTLSSYLPYSLAARILRAPEESVLNRGERFAAVTLFADMAGFTPLAEALGQAGPEGTEQLTEILNGRFTPMIEEVHRWGGVVGKFAGDAMVVLFPEDDPHDTALRTLACAWSLQRQIRRFGAVETLAGPFTLKIKLGLAAGTVLQVVAGNPQRAEFVYAGRPLDDAAAAEHHAAPGEIVLHPSLVERLTESDINGRPLEAGFVRLEALPVEVRPRPHFPLPKTSDEAAAVEQLRPFLPPSIYERLAAGQELLVNEHRRVTILFLSFSGIDYEALDAVERLTSYIADLFATVEQYGGHVRQVEMGDKGSKAILLFGAPVAYENDEERALLCALALQRLARESPVVHEQHIGVNSGRVFVGNVGSPRRQEYAAIGDAVNLAARLMQAAGQEKVLVGESCYRRMTDRFTWSEPTAIRVKGKAEPVQVRELAGRRVGQVLRLQEPRYALPMVGRKGERTHLVDLLNAVLREGRGRVVGLTAEAGMGKSRLAAEVIARALAQGFVGYGGYGLSHGTQTPYLACRPLLRGLLEVEDGRPVQEQAEAIALRLAEVHPDLPPRLPLLGDALGLPIPDNDLTGAFDARLRRESLFSLVVDLVRHRAAQAPLLLVVEDAHWLDELSAELVRHIARNILDLPVLLLTIYRPPEVEGAPVLWSPRPAYVEEILLGPFSSEESAELVRLKLAGRELPEMLLRQIEQRAQGNPFFVDEFINLLVEQGVDLDAPHALERVWVPESLERLIVSRIDQLAESEKTTLRVASVIGRLFRARWLLAIYPGEVQSDLLRRDLDRLSALDLAPLDRSDPELEYLFKHALTREVAYQGISFSARRMLHERVAAYIEAAYTDELEAWYGILAYQYGRAGLPEKEFTYLRLAADQAARQSAHRQAATLYDRALALAEEHALGTPAEVFALREKRFHQYLILGQYERPLEDAAAMEELAADLAVEFQVKALIHQGEAGLRMGRHQEASVSLEAAADLARKCGDREDLLEALRLQGVLYFDISDYTRSKPLLLRVIAEAGEEGWRQESLASQIIGWIAYDEGDYARCERYWKRALELMRAHGNKAGESLVLNNLGSLYTTLNYIGKGLEHAEQGLAQAQQIGYMAGQVEGWLRLGEHHLAAGQYEQALLFMEKALDVSNRLTVDVWGQTYIRNRMAEAVLGQDGDLGEADRLARKALEIGREGGNELVGWLYHTVGRVACRQGDLEEARKNLEASAQARRELGQWTPYAHTLADLGEVYLEQGDLPAARRVAEELLGLLFPEEGSGIEGSEEIAVAWACSRILREAGEERWKDLLAHAYQSLQRYAGRLETEELRRSFLENIAVHREVAKAYAAMTCEGRRPAEPFAG